MGNSKGARVDLSDVPTPIWVALLTIVSSAIGAAVGASGRWLRSAATNTDAFEGRLLARLEQQDALIVTITADDAKLRLDNAAHTATLLNQGERMKWLTEHLDISTAEQKRQRGEIEQLQMTVDRLRIALDECLQRHALTPDGGG